jgi:ketosteroid isomerase-like protein
MTSNRDVLRRGIGAMNRGDVEGMLAESADDVVIWARRSAVAGEYRGHDGVRRLLADNVENFEAYRVDYTDVRDLGDDRLLVIGTVHIKVRGGGVATDAPSAGIAEFENGKLKRWHDYGDRGEALAAAGVES